MHDDTTDGRPAVGDAEEAVPAMLVIDPDGPGERSTPVYDWLAVGRECVGIDERHRLLIDDPAVSRTHLELRLDFGYDQAWLTDLSTNGTRLNGQRIARSVPVQIRPGDRIRLGPAELQFRSRRFTAEDAEPDADRKSTLRDFTVLDLVMVVGDIVGFSTIAEITS